MTSRKPVTEKPDYFLNFERKILNWALSIIGTLIIGFIGFIITAVITLNRLEVQFEDHVKSNIERFNGVDQRISNTEQRATGNDKRSLDNEQRAIQDREKNNNQ